MDDRFWITVAATAILVAIGASMYCMGGDQ